VQSVTQDYNPLAEARRLLAGGYDGPFRGVIEALCGEVERVRDARLAELDYEIRIRDERIAELEAKPVEYRPLSEDKLTEIQLTALRLSGEVHNVTINTSDLRDHIFALLADTRYWRARAMAAAETHSDA